MLFCEEKNFLILTKSSLKQTSSKCSRMFAWQHRCYVFVD